ncbi:hypothetical protein [Azospirillum sp. sgz302134]
MRLLIALLPLGLLALDASTVAAAVAEPNALPPGYVEEPEVPPEDKLPPMPEEFPPAPTTPVFTAPDARSLLAECKKDTSFTDCFRLWRPPPPPPKEEKKQAKQTPPLPLDPKLPRKPAEGGPLTGPPTPPNPAADRATYDSLVKALQETGLEGKVLMTEPPKDGTTTMQLDPKSNKTAPKK